MKKLIIILIIIILFFAGAYLFIKNKKKVETPAGEAVAPVTFKDFFPFNQQKTPTTPTTPNENPDTNPDVTPTPAVPPKLRLITKNPSSGIEPFEKIITPAIYEEKVVTVKGKKQTIKTLVTPAITAPGVRFVDRATGHINETLLDTISIADTTDTTIPRIQEALTGEGNVILRYLNIDNYKTIETYLATITAPTGTSNIGTLTGSFLPDDISTVAMNSDGNKIFYLFPFSSGVAGVVHDLVTGKKNQLFTSAFHEWLATWTGPSITLTTKASGYAEGFAYTIDPATGTMSKIVGNIAGLTTRMSPDGKMILLGVGGNTVVINFYTLATKQSSRLPANTMPEKCTWSNTNTRVYCGVPKSIPSGVYPDDWYQGTVNFSDSIWAMGTDGVGREIADPQSIGATIDAIDLVLDPPEKNLFFVNKKDGSLWVLDIEE